MKKILITFFVAFIINSFSFAQITIDQNDMPDAGDTIRVSITLTTNGVDYTLTDTGYTWDFSGLSPVTQRVDTFVSVTSTPIAYQFLFNNPFDQVHKATIAIPQQVPDSLGSITLSDIYNFYKETGSSFSLVGFGANISGIPLPVKYDNVDVIYKFPIVMGNTDSCNSSFTIQIPGLGYVGQKKKRVSTVDGWGTLITPFGTFQTIRIKSIITESDTVHLDSSGMSIPTIERTTTEYKWFGKGYGLPLLEISESGFSVTVTYMDSIRSTLFSIDEPQAWQTSVRVFPNPADDNVCINYEIYKPANVELALYSVLGVKIKTLFHSHQNAGKYTKVVNLKAFDIPAGTYLIKMNADESFVTKHIIVN